MALTKVGGDIIRQPLDIGSLNATTVQIGAATTVHTTGIDVGSGSVTGHNIHSTGIVTATSFVGPVTGNLTGNADTASNLTGSPSITVTNITASGNVSIAGTLTYEDVTNIDAVGVVTARAGVRVTGGSVGIGTDNPSARLDVYKNFTGVSAGTYAGRVYGLDSGVNETGVRFVTKGTGDLHNASDAYLMHGISNGTTRFVFGANGNVGIGTDNPTLRAHIYSTDATDAALIESNQNHATLRFKSAVNSSGPTIGIDGGGGLQFDQKDTSKYISFAIGSNGEKLRISSTGQLHLNGTTGKSTSGTSATDLLMANNAAIRFRKADDSAWINSVGLDSNNNLKLGWGGSTSAIHFGISGIGDQMFLDSAGRLLLGTTTEGAVNADNFTVADSGNCGITIRSGTSNSGNLYFSDATSGTGEFDGAVAYEQTDNRMMFYTASTERLRITSDGKFGFNDNNPERTIDVRGSNCMIQLEGTGGNGRQYSLCSSDDATGTAVDGGPSGTFAIYDDTASVARLRITSAGDVNIPGGILNLGTIGAHSAHINSPELMSFNIDTDNDDTNRYFIFRTNAATNSGTELMRLTEGGNLGIGGVDPATGDGGNSNYNNWDIPKLHVRGSSSSGKFHLLGRFHAGNDSDNTGAQIVIHHENDRGMALQGGRSSGNRSYGAIKSLDNLSRESNVMVFTGGTGQGVENIKFYTNGGSTGTNERMSINTYGTVHTGGSTEINQSTLTPDLITQAGCVSPMFYRPFGGMSAAPSTSGPGYVDFGTGGVRHNLTDPHLGASYGGAQFQGGLINSYGQTFSNTASGTTREAMNWNRFRILFRGLCPSSGYSVATVKFRYSTYHYSNGWQDHAGTEWTYTGTESERGARWVVGPWINPSSYFTSWADVPAFGLYYNDNSSGRTFRIAGGVYFQFAHFI